MNLTEPQAGSDVGALRARAEPIGDGSYAITGQKIFISWGDTDFAANTCHLVLARLPGGAPGTKGISLFLVPKFLPDADGNPGVPNDLRVVSLEHKMGLHGSPTAVMDYAGAKGWLIGRPHDGMRCMFTMMNNARLGVGVQGLSVAEAAYQQALDYALERRQGGSGPIFDYPDVRRMLAAMKGDIFAARAIALACAVAIDLQTATGDPAHAARAALLTPIAKAFGTETGIRVSESAMQVYGGMGFIEETGIAQYYRDVRVTAIYEGTNGIQALDLVGRKLADGGKAAFALIDEMRAGIAGSDMEDPVRDALDALQRATDWMLAQPGMTERGAGAVPYLMGFARVLGGCYHLQAAAAENGDGPRTRLARAYVAHALPEHISLFAQAVAGTGVLLSLSAGDMGA